MDFALGGHNLHKKNRGSCAVFPESGCCPQPASNALHASAAKAD